MNTVNGKWDYLYELKLAIEKAHQCSALYLRTKLVDITTPGKTSWVGDIEVFALTNRSKTVFGYAWKRGGRLVIVLGEAPVDCPEAAVGLSLGSDSKHQSRALVIEV